MNNERRSPKAETQSRRLRQALVVSPLVFGNAVMLALCLLGFQVLSATRGYVGGESMWSKGRAQAMQHLRAYAIGGDAASLRAYEKALDGPLGDRDARIELDKPRPDYEAARRGFERGGIAPADLPSMMQLYRWFGDSQLMAGAVEAWSKADERLLALQAIAGRLQRLHDSPLPAEPLQRTAEVAAALSELDQLESELRALEYRYTTALGEASRTTFHSLSLLVAASTFVLTLTVFLLVRHGLRRQERYEIALEDANRRWALAAEGDGLGVFEWRTREDLIDMDAIARAAYGIPPDPFDRPVPRARLKSLIDPEDAPRLSAALDQVLQEGQVFRLRYRIRPDGSDGVRRHIELNAVMRGSLEDGDRRMIGIVRDVSERVRQERAELDRATAERTASARMEFLSRLSHELRTPLNAVLGFSELLTLDASEPLTPRQLQRVQLVTDAGRHLLHLVDDVLDISRIDSGRLSVERVATSVAAVLQTAAALTESERQEYQVSLELPELPSTLAVWGDPHRLGQVLANLLSNGFKYNRPGGQVRVLVAHEEGGEQLRIEVHDEGPGLDDTQLRQLFQAFTRLPSATHRRGTGLGLTIVKLLVEQMGGRVDVRSRIGEGSVFGVTLDLAPAKLGEPWPAASAPSSPPSC